MLAEELAVDDVLASGGTVVANVDHGTYRAVVARHDNREMRINNYDVGYDVPLQRPQAVQDQLDALDAIIASRPPAPAPVHPQTGHGCTSCRQRDDYLEDVAERRAEDARY